MCNIIQYDFDNTNQNNNEWNNIQIILLYCVQHYTILNEPKIFTPDEFHNLLTFSLLF